jgi:hypothetical protein
MKETERKLKIRREVYQQEFQKRFWNKKEKEDLK